MTKEKIKSAFRKSRHSKTKRKGVHGKKDLEQDVANATANYIYFLSLWTLPQIERIVRKCKLKEPYKSITKKVLWEKALKERLL